MARRVVITGLGLATPLGLEVETNWRRALEGISGVTALNLQGAEHSPIRGVGSVKEEDWSKIQSQFQKEAATEGERRTLFALWAARAALDDAGIDGGHSYDRFGVLLAAGLGIVRLEDMDRWLSAEGRFDFARFGREYQEVCRDSMLRNLTHRAASLIARKFRLHGPNCTVTAACASATQALGLAYKSVQRGDADAMVAGGADSMINHLGLAGFSLLQAAATGPVEPALLCRPFDRKRSGLVIGEGAGVAILEEAEHAERRGARIYGEVAGYGSSLDAYQVTAPEPRGRGAVRCMKAALGEAGMGRADIDYINAHGTSTKLNDAVETLAIKEVFQDRARDIPISSSKSLIGHLMAAAGGPEFVFTVMSVWRDEIHPTINLTHPDPKCDLDYVANVKRQREVRAALSNSFGFGGQNATIIVRKYRGQ
jgi:3-oxoacyl-[acyl-carrier-protein] synthase II